MHKQLGLFEAPTPTQIVRRKAAEKTETYDLYNGTPPHAGTYTSVDAALKAKPKIGNRQGLVLTKLRIAGPGGMTDHELTAALGLPLQSVVPRRRELVQLGLVKDSGDRRATPSGRKAIVWTLPYGWVTADGRGVPKSVPEIPGPDAPR